MGWLRAWALRRRTDFLQRPRPSAARRAQRSGRAASTTAAGAVGDGRAQAQADGAATASDDGGATDRRCIIVAANSDRATREAGQGARRLGHRRRWTTALQATPPAAAGRCAGLRLARQDRRGRHAPLRTRPTVTVLEIHPEVSFATMTGAPILASKKTDDGHSLRLEGAALPRASRGRPSSRAQGYAVDDVLDACAVAWSPLATPPAWRGPLPDPPEVVPTASPPPSGSQPPSRPRMLPRPGATAYLDPAWRSSGAPGLRRSAGDGAAQGSGGRVPAGLRRVDELGGVAPGRADRPEPRLGVVGDGVRVEAVDAATPGALDGVDEVVVVATGLGVELGDAARLRSSPRRWRSFRALPAS